MEKSRNWTQEELKYLCDSWGQISMGTLANYINRSAQACNGKIERLVKEGVIYSRSEFRATC